MSEDVAREALLKFVGKKWTYSSKPAQNLVFKDLRPFTVYRVNQLILFYHVMLMTVLHSVHL